VSTKGFTGGAGTGKTFCLLRELNAHLAAHPLEPGQSVLALTFMHGSRHRLAERLAQSAARGHCECLTLDRFAWDLCRRWRSRLRAGGGFVPLDMDAPDYDGTCEAAGRLLASEDVAQWVVARHPVIVLDEFQDCASVRLALARNFHGRAKLLVAADDFQNLNSTDESPAVAWLRGLGVSEELTVNRRTADADLIAAAQALRSGAPLIAGTNPSFKLISAQSQHVAASFISQTMAPAASSDVVMISASRAGASPWVEKIIQLVGTKQYGKQKSGPVLIKWEMTAEGLIDATIGQLGIAEGNGAIGTAAILALPRGPVAHQLKRWAENQRRLLGRTEFGAAELRAQIKRIVQRIRSFGSIPQGGRRAMTIHQAKNREFPVVIVLWPFRVVGEPVLARRWLYNAITRAKRRAIVIVEDPQQNRLGAPPFAYPAAAALAPVAAPAAPGPATAPATAV
jgi:hypothetical protein